MASQGGGRYLLLSFGLWVRRRGQLVQQEPGPVLEFPGAMLQVVGAVVQITRDHAPPLVGRCDQQVGADCVGDRDGAPAQVR
jgi:hypothetical protein